MTRVEFEAELAREGYQLREAAIEPNARREHTEADGVRFLVGTRQRSAT